jgi:hypothetical protein
MQPKWIIEDYAPDNKFDALGYVMVGIVMMWNMKQNF